MLRVILSLPIALTLLLSLPIQANAVLVTASPKTQVPAFSNDGSESRIGLLCHNDPVNKSDPMGLSPTSEAIFTSAGEVIGFLLSLPVDAAEDLSTAGVGVLANPATTIGMTAAGGLAGRSLDHLINGNPSRNSFNQEGNRSREARANNPNSDISRAVSRFEKQKLGQQMKEYKNLEKTFKDHLKDYGQEAGATKGEVNRIERQLEQYRKILEDRGALPKTK